MLLLGDPANTFPRTSSANSKLTILSEKYEAHFAVQIKLTPDAA